MEKYFKSIFAGILASLLVFIFYFGFLVWGQGTPEAATAQFLADIYFVLPITLGFGLQVGLFSYLRWLVQEREVGGAASVGVSTATSTVSMVACCAHRILDILPVLGLSGALIFLASFRSYFLILALLSNLFGIIYMGRKIFQIKGVKRLMAR